MGCDIHLYQEKRIDGKWVAADVWSIDPRYPEDRASVGYKQRLYASRNYRVFAALANVRNGFGFAGIQTGTPIRPISEPRGIPVDSCPEIKAEAEAWGVDGHSHSWLTLADIEGYDTTAPSQHRGIMTLAVYQAWKASGNAQPEEWSGDVSGPGIKIIGDDIAVGLMRSYRNDRLYVEAWWTTKTGDDMKHFNDAVLPRLRKLEAECGPGNARVVFFFDN